MSAGPRHPTHRIRLFRSGLLHLDLETCVYATVILMTVLAVSTDDHQADYGDVTGLVLGPMVATGLAHLFASLLAFVNRSQSFPDRKQLGHLVVHAGQFLVVAAVPLAIVAFAAVTGTMSPATVITRLSDLLLLALIVLGGFGGWRAGGGRWWPVVVGAGATGVIAIAVAILKATLEHH